MPGIYHIYVDVLHIHGIYIVYPWIYHVYPSDWIYHGYTMYIHQVYTWYIHGYTWYIIWCIYIVYMWYIVVYPWIFLAFWNQISRPAHAAGLIQWAHACGWSRVFYSTCHHGNCPRGKGSPQKAQPYCSQRSLPVAGGGSDGSGCGGVAGGFPFPSLVAGNDLNLGERWGRGCRQDRWPMCQRALTLACAENWDSS